MSSLESKKEKDTKLSDSNKDNNNSESKKEKEFDWDDYILQEDDIQCSICNGIHEKGTFARTPGIKKKGSKKTYSRYDICGNCQNKTHLCSNNCGTYLSINTYINGHNLQLCKYAKAKLFDKYLSDLSDNNQKLLDENHKLKNQLEEANTWRKFWSREYDSLQKKYEILEEKYEIFFDIIQKMKTHIEYDL